MPSPADLLGRSFGTLPDLIAAHAETRPSHPALLEGDRAIDYAAFQALVDRIAASLQQAGVGRGAVAAICASASIEYAAAFVAILRAGAAVAPLLPSSSAESLAAMLRDCGARLLFLDMGGSDSLVGGDVPDLVRVALDGSAAGLDFGEWIAPVGSRPSGVETAPEDPFNIIYSSGTTGTPKGIVQSHAMRWPQITAPGLFPPDAVTMVSTPLPSNTTLVAFLPTLANGGTAVLMRKFDAGEFLALSARYRATHAMLVPVQFRRLMQHPAFADFDLSSYRMKLSTSAPFPAALKRDVLARWPGGLIEFYGMTEGGGSTGLLAHLHPDKLDTVGQPLPGHDIRVIGEDGLELGHGSVGEIVGRSPAMMSGYLGQPEKTTETMWFSPEGVPYIRTGDLGAFDGDGFLTLLGRKKDMIISGGFNIFPSDLEAELLRHPAVLEAAVVGVPSELWGETPVAFAVLRPGEPLAEQELLEAANARLGKLQRLAGLHLVPSLPRSPIGKVLKRELRDRLLGAGESR